MAYGINPHVDRFSAFSGPPQGAEPRPYNRYDEHNILAAVRSGDKKYIQSSRNSNGVAEINGVYNCKHGALKNRAITPFHLAVNLLKKEMAAFLLQQGADINSEMAGGKTALIVCIELNKNLEMLNFLLDNGAKKESNPAPLHSACLVGWIEGITTS